MIFPRTCILLICLFQGFFTLSAQDNEKKLVENVIIELFDGMRAGDSSRVHTLFDKEVRMYSAGIREGHSYIIEDSIESFLLAIGTPHAETWDERIFETKIEIDGPLAIVWTNYSFFIGDTFSHCGIDLFQLIQRKNGWKIFQITDTRRKTSCKED